jgi:hypothetical protein
MSPEVNPTQLGETNMTSSNAIRTVKSLAHASALIFGAFWLVATTNVQGPPRECFTGIAKETKLRVTLGSPLFEIDGGMQSLPSCNALDGLMAGGAPTFTLSRIRDQRDRGHDRRDALGAARIRGI